MALKSWKERERLKIFLIFFIDRLKFLKIILFRANSTSLDANFIVILKIYLKERNNIGINFAARCLFCGRVHLKSEKVREEHKAKEGDVRKGKLL